MKRLLILFLLSSKLSYAQKWWTITKNDLLIVGVGFVGGGADAYNQRILHHKYGAGKPFWDYATSYKRKYKDFDNGDLRAAYPGSKTWLVMTTDGYHLTRAVDRFHSLFTIGITAYEWNEFKGWNRVLFIGKKVLLSGVSNRIAFNLIYK
jgi:hypothetical protein